MWPGGRYRDNITSLRQSRAGSEGAEGLCCQVERRWIEPCRPSIWQISAHAARPSTRRAEFAGSDKNFTVREVFEAAVVIHVQMSENDSLHVARPDAQRA